MSELPKKQDNPKSFQLNDPRTNESNLDQPHIENKKRQRNQVDAIKVEKKFTSVNDESFHDGNSISFPCVSVFTSGKSTQVERNFNMNVPLVPSNLGLTQKNQNQINSPHQYTGKLEPCIGIKVNKIPREFEIDNEFLSDYSDIEMSPSPENRVLYPSLDIGKFVPVVLKPVNPSSLVPTNPKSHQSDIDDIPARRFPSPALSISPRFDNGI